METYIARQDWKEFKKGDTYKILMLSRYYNNGLRIKAIVYNKNMREVIEMYDVTFNNVFKKL